jgi:hypothetical protein
MLTVSDAHEVIKAAASKVPTANWQSCRVACMRNALTYAPATSPALERKFDQLIIGYFVLRNLRNHFSIYLRKANHFPGNIEIKKK